MAYKYVYNGTSAERETERALLVRLASGATHWVPKSVVHDDSEVYRDGDTGKLVLLGWFAQKEGIDGDADDDQED